MRLPAWAQAALALVPLRDLRGDVEADLAELFGDRRVRYGRFYAHRRLAGDLASLWRGSRRGGTMIRDLRFGLRLIRRHPTPVAIAIGGLALAIGAVTSVFTLVDATMLRPHGMDDPGTVVRLNVPGHSGWAYWPYRSFVRMNTDATLSRVEASLLEKVSVSRHPSPDEEVASRWMLFVSGGYHELFGGRPALGRAIQPSDDQPGAPPVIVVSHHLWMTAFNGDASVVGSMVRVNDTAVTLVGVLAADFTGPVRTRPSIWAPLSAYDDVRMGTAFHPASGAYVEVFGRLARGATLPAAQDNLSAIIDRSKTGSEHAHEGNQPSVLLAREASPIDAEGAEGYIAIAGIFGVLALVLALACANTANLLLAGAATRMREIGIRLAMGSTTRRLIGQLLNESVLLGLMAGALGLLFSIWFTPILRSAIELAPDLEIGVDMRVLLFTIAVALICGVAAGISPARYGARGDVLSTLKSQRPSHRAAAPSRLRTSFVGFQAGVSMLLLVSAALLTRTTLQMTRTGSGFDADRLVTVSISDGRTKFDEVSYLQSATSTLRGMPAVERVSITQYIPFGFSTWRDELAPAGRSYTLYFNRTDDDFFTTAGLRVLRGRTFTTEEIAEERPVAVISDSVARTFFPAIDPIGQPVSAVPGEDARQLPASIIGVVADAMLMRLRTEQFGAIYLPLERKRANTPGLLVRTPTPGLASRAIEDALRKIAPRVRVTTAIVAEQVEAYVGEKRMLAWLAGPTAVLALVLAVLGLYGVTAFAVSHRTPEISVRLAIGATASDVLRLLVREGLRPVVVGLAAGLAAALVVSRIFASHLSGISPYDPPAIAIAVVTLLTSAVIAVVMPARRAMRTDPATVLRQL
jgi:predicted permease